MPPNQGHSSSSIFGNRIVLATGGNVVSILEVAQILKENLGDVARKVPVRPLSSWLLRVIGLFDLQVRTVLPELGKQHKNASNEKAGRLLGWSPRSPKNAVLATARSLLDLGLLKP